MTIGIIGLGRLGTAVARQSLRSVYSVRVTNSEVPDSSDLILSGRIKSEKSSGG